MLDFIRIGAIFIPDRLYPSFAKALRKYDRGRILTSSRSWQ